VSDVSQLITAEDSLREHVIFFSAAIFLMQRIFAVQISAFSSSSDNFGTLKEMKRDVGYKRQSGVAARHLGPHGNRQLPSFGMIA